jgi:hypothetical protein
MERCGYSPVRVNVVQTYSTPLTAVATNDRLQLLVGAILLLLLWLAPARGILRVVEVVSFRYFNVHDISFF